MFAFTKSIAAAASFVALAAQPALAQDRLAETIQATPDQSAQIDVSNTSLKSDRDWNRVADAIRAKAADLCERTVTASERRDAEIEECTQSAYENGVQQMRAIYARRTLATETRLARS